MTAHIRKKGFADRSDWITAEGDTRKNNKITRIIPIAKRTKNFIEGRNITVAD
jgi:hypothetical protein